VIAAGDLIILHGDQWLRRQQRAGTVVSEVLRTFANHVKQHPEKLTLKELEQEAADIIAREGCTPTFKGYRGFPGAVCISVNEELVHGIPSDRELQEGDLITMDVGVTFEGAIGDAAFTCVYGERRDSSHVELLTACQTALQKAVQSVQLGKRIGTIGHVISKEARAKCYGVIVKYGGHGLGYDKPHAKPFVANQATPAQGVRIQPGMAIAIEPMFVMGSPATTVKEDGWTVVTEGIGCHFEHSVTIGPDGQRHCITEHGMNAKDYA
jgi:methionyl aminopeptidase